MDSIKLNKKSEILFFVKIIIPIFLTIALFISTIYFVFIPKFAENSINHKREKIKELTESAASILMISEQAVRDGAITKKVAKEQAVAFIKGLRYGPEGKDYFWITDTQPKMIMHPYNPELNNQNVSNFVDRQGKQMFMEFVSVAKNQGAGYVDYFWQWKDDATKIVPKLSYVQYFEPWDWVLGTGVYIEDVKQEIQKLTSKLIKISLAIITLIVLILAYVTKQSHKIEQKRRAAELALLAAKERELGETKAKYEILTNNINIGVFRTTLDKKGEFLEANPVAIKMFGFNSKEELFKTNTMILFHSAQERKAFLKKLLNKGEAKNELVLLKNKLGGSRVISVYAVLVKDENGSPKYCDGIVEDITEQKFLDQDKERLISELQTALLQNKRYSASKLIHRIQTAVAPEEIFNIKTRLHSWIKALINVGADPNSIAELVTSITDFSSSKFIDFAINKLGTPPTRFAFIALGSQGRNEQTLKTDQDNAIIFEDIDEKKQNEVREYFLALAHMVCGWLDKAGYPFCNGEVMAKNQKWCQPLATWKDYFKKWVTEAGPDELMEVNIFFDFRYIYGKEELANDLRSYLNSILKDKASFYNHLTKNCLHYKPPIGFFGNIVVESAEEHKESFSIKKAMTPISDFVRIYALNNGVSSTNTIDRLAALNNLEAINEKDYQEICYAFNYLINVKLKHQADLIKEGKELDNYITPKTLTKVEQKILKEIFSQITNFQKKLSFDFTGKA